MVDWKWIQRATSNKGSAVMREGSDVCSYYGVLVAHWNTPADVQSVTTKEGGSFVVRAHHEGVDTSITFAISRLEALEEESPVINASSYTMPLTSFNNQTTLVSDEHQE